MKTIRSVLLLLRALLLAILFAPLLASAAGEAVAVYAFEEGTGTRLTDLSGNGNTGTLNNDPAWADGKHGKGMSFDGGKRFVDVADSASFAFADGDYTMSAWIYLRALDGVSFLGKYGVSGNGWRLLVSPSGRFSFQANGGTSYTDTDLVKTNQWVHVAVVKSATALKLYVNALDRTAYGRPPGSVDNAAPFQIGTTLRPSIGGCCQQYANAIVDDVRIYKRALTQAEMQADMNVAAADTVAPAVPQNLRALAASTTEIELAWSPSADNIGVTGYRVLRDGAQVADVAAPAYRDAGLAPDTGYRYTVLAYDAAGNLSAQSSAALARTPAVFDFSVTNAGARSVTAGQSVSNTISAALGGGASQNVAFTIAGLPAATTAAFSPAACALSCTSAVTLKTASTTPAGIYQINVTATGGGLVRSTIFLLTISAAPAFDFSLASGGARSVAAGQSVANSVSASLLSGTARSVAFSASGLPAGITASFSSASCTPTCSSTLTLQSAASTPAGSYPITVSASGGVTRTASFTLTVTAPAAGGIPTIPVVDFMPSNYAGKHLIAYAKGANLPADFIGIEVAGQVPLLLSLSSGRYNTAVALTSEQIVFLIDGVPVSPVLSSPFGFTWDSTTVADGAHVLTALLVDGPADLAAYAVEPSVLVVDNHAGPITAAQRIPSIGISRQSMRLASATPDWLQFSGGIQPQHNIGHPYPYQAVPPAHALADPAKALHQANWVLEALNLPNTGLYSGRPRYFQTKGGHIVSKQFNTQAGSTSEFAATALPLHGNFDGPRNDNAVSMYSTFAPEPNGSNWLGIDVAGRLFRVSSDGAVATLAGPVTKRDFMPFDIADTSIGAARRDQLQMELKGNFDGALRFKLSIDLAIDPRNPNIVYVADAGNRRIAKVDLSVQPAHISTFAGNPAVSGSQDGSIASATFVEPWSIAIADDGTLYVADRGGNAIRKISADGATVSTVVNAANGITAPFVIRLDSQGNILLGENKTALLKRIAPATKTVTTVATACASEWMWLDVDRKANVGSKDDTLVVCGTGGSGNTVMLRIPADGASVKQILDGGGAKQQGNLTNVQDAHGHYPWIVAIDDEEARIMTGGFGDTGLHMLRMTLPGDAPIHSYDGTLYSQGREIFRRGTLVGFPFGARPSFTSLLGETGHGFLGLKTFDDLSAYSDAELIAYLQAGMGGSVPRPEITGKDMRALLYYVRSNMLNALTQLPAPLPLPTDKTPAVIGSVTVTPIDATSARVDWTTDEPSIGFVEFGPSSAYHRWSEIEDGYATTHSAVLKYLPAGKAIHYAIRVKDNAGNQTLTADRSFVTSGNVVMVPTLSFSAKPSNVLAGKSTTLAWVASDAGACTASGGWSGSKALSGSAVSAALTVSTTFTLTCSSSAGSVAKSVTVTVGAAATPTLALTAPLGGATVSGTPLIVTYAVNGDMAGVHHVNLQLDGNPEVSDLDFDGAYAFANVAAGTHTVRAYLANAANAKVAGSAEVQLAFTVSANTQSVVSAVRSGLWSAPATWSTGNVPTAASAVKISGPIAVEYDLPYDGNPGAEAASITIDNGATLSFSRTRSTRLDLDGSLSVLSGGVLDVGSPQNPIPANLNAYLGFNVVTDRLFSSPTAISPLPSDAAYHPEDTGLWITSGGKITINGAPKPSIWFTLAKTAAAGSNSVTLSGTPAGFRIGDRIVLTPSGSGPRETEIKTITAIAGNTLTLDSALAYLHEGQRYALNTATGVARAIDDGAVPGANEIAVDVRSEAGLLTQNVVVASNLVKPGDTHHRAHTIFLHGSTGTFEYAEFRDLGPRGKKGRYPIHLHLTGDSSVYVVQGVSVWNQFEPGNKWVVLHMSRDAILKDSVGYNAQGRGFYMEDGTEANNTVERNLGVGVYGPEEVPNTTDIAALQQLTRPGVFWLRMNNTIRDNVAAGGDVDVSGYWITPALVPGPATVFSRNEARGNAFGLYFSGGELFNPELSGSRLIRNDVAVWADSFVKPALRNTLFYGNRDLGIPLDDASGSVISSDPSAGTPAQPPAGVPTLTFSASAQSVKPGATVTLSWFAQGASECDASGDWNGVKASSGSFTTAAIESAKTFALICRNAAGAAIKSVQVALDN